MPWMDLTHNQKIDIYKEIFKEIVDSPKDIDLIVQEMLIQSEMLRHDFTKRQMVIITFIMTLSFTFGKREAYIPKVIDFEVVGISSKYVHSELNKLVMLGVLKWDKEEKLFSVKNPTRWDVPISSGHNYDRARQLFYLNMEQAGIDVQPFLKKNKDIKSFF
jgi:hypothetical protein